MSLPRWGWIALLLLAVSTRACAEWFGALYGGVAYTPRSDITLVITRASGPLDHTFHDVEWENSPEFGLRAGYWLESVPWFGFGLDLFRFNADVPRQTVDVTIQGVRAPVTLQPIDFAVFAIGFDIVRLRYPLMRSSEYPGGRLQPYATAGPALFRIRVKNEGNGELSPEPAYDTVTGYKLGAGLSWQLTAPAAIFAEYRFTHLHSETVLGGRITGATVPMRFDLDTHHLIAGVSFRF